MKMSEETFYLVAKMTAAPGKYDELHERLVEMVRLTNQEPSMIAYDLYKDLEDSNTFCFIESWSSKAAWDIHMEMPHVKALIADQYDLTSGINIARLNRI